MVRFIARSDRHARDAAVRAAERPHRPAPGSEDRRDIVRVVGHRVGSGAQFPDAHYCPDGRRTGRRGGADRRPDVHRGNGAARVARAAGVFQPAQYRYRYFRRVLQQLPDPDARQFRRSVERIASIG